MYVVKVGEYYVKNAKMYEERITPHKIKGYMGDIVLSKELQMGTNKVIAEFIAKKLNGEVIKLTEEVSNG